MTGMFGGNLNDIEEDFAVACYAILELLSEEGVIDWPGLGEQSFLSRHVCWMSWSITGNKSK